MGEEDRPARQVLVIGLDGATWTLLRPLAAAGLLPHLSQLIEEGASGVLESTIPPLTAAAWVSFQTGQNPGKHGIYDFFRYDPIRQDLTIVNAADVRGGVLWDLLGQAGRRVGVINVPFTYPPRPVNGYLIGGLMSPRAEDAFWPPTLYDEVQAEVGDYPIFIPVRSFAYLGLVGFLDRLTHMVTQRAETALYLLSRYPTDFTIVQFQSLDVVQHALWPWLNSQHPSYSSRDPGERERVCDYFRHLDTQVGRLVAAAGPETTVIVMSDHGFGPVYWRLYLNQWLADQGFLQVRGGSRLVRWTGWVEQGLQRLDVLKLRRRLIAPFGGRERLVRRVTQDALIDWQRTQVFAPSGVIYGLVRINLRGRDREGIVAPGDEYEAVRQAVAERALEWRNPESGRPVIQQVYRREEIYHGPQVANLPDLILRPIPGYQFDTRFKDNLQMGPMPPDLWANHLAEGVVVFSGPGVRSGITLDRAHIMDLAPTILYLLGVSVPVDMDGHVLSEALEPTVLASWPVQMAEVATVGLSGASAVYSPEDEAEVSARLRELGYLS